MDIINWINYERLTLYEYYPALAISNLIQMLNEPQGLTFFHKEIVNALYQIFVNLNNRAQYVDRVRFFIFLSYIFIFYFKVIPPLIMVVENCKPDLREFFLTQFSKFSSLIRLDLQPYMAQFFGLISVFFIFLIHYKFFYYRKHGVGVKIFLFKVVKNIICF